MSEFHINVVRLGDFNPHPNADVLDITKVFDYQVISRRGTFKPGDLAVYIPVDSVLPDTEEWHFMAPVNSDGSVRFQVGNVPQKYRIVEAKKIRGIFSQGMLAPLPPGDWNVGDDVCEAMGITKYEPPVPMTMGGECEAAPKGWIFPVYTDVEGLRRYPNVLTLGEEVVLTEKIHGANARYVHDGERLWVGSHTQIKKQDTSNMWWQVAFALNLEQKLAMAPMKVFFGEVYGQVQDLKYGVKTGSMFRVFDVYDVKEQRYLDYVDACKLIEDCGLERVPQLYMGPWNPDELNPMCEGSSTLADNVREGFVVKPLKERWDPTVGRVILKRHGEGYLTRKKK